MKTVFLFSGQGSQYLKMGQDLLNDNQEFNSIYETAEKVLGYSLRDIVFGEDDAKLNRTIYSQPAIMATSLLAFEVANKNGIAFEAVAGHSLGEYASMVVSGMLSLEDGFKVISARAEAMEKCAEKNKGSMVAVMKLPAEKIEGICREIDGYVVPVNYNSPAQTVIAGEQSAVSKAVEALSGAGARCIPLKVASAFHSELMREASEEFYSKIKDVKFNAPSVKFYSNVLGTELKDFSDMPSLLAKHIVSPVKFTSEMAEMSKDGFDTFIELGPNKVLTGLVKKTLKEATALNIENNATLEKALEELKKA